MIYQALGCHVLIGHVHDGITATAAHAYHFNDGAIAALFYYIKIHGYFSCCLLCLSKLFEEPLQAGLQTLDSGCALGTRAL